MERSRSHQEERQAVTQICGSVRDSGADWLQCLPFEVASRVVSMHDVFHVSNLRKYLADPSHVLRTSELEVQENLCYEELPVRIVDRKEQVLRSKIIPWVKVIWKNHGVEEATWEGEEDMRHASTPLHTRYEIYFRGRKFLSGGEL